ncbi:MAG: hypothetical protein ACYDAZ_03755 [Thermoplasmataceae archaeon]
MSIRIVKIKGREYAQEVEYRWDPVEKVGRTVVLRHIGPVRPLNPERYTKVEYISPPTRARVRRTRKEDNRTVKSGVRESTKQKKLEFLPLTPPPKLISKVLTLVRDSDKSLNRKDVYNLLLKESRKKPVDPETLRKQIGFALTILEREGKISRTGKGVIGAPYLYSSI